MTKVTIKSTGLKSSQKTFKCSKFTRLLLMMPCDTSCAERPNCWTRPCRKNKEYCSALIPTIKALECLQQGDTNINEYLTDQIFKILT